MSSVKQLEQDRPPDVTFGPLRLWIHGREFPEATDVWDANWLRLTACCAESGASVMVSGSILDTVSVVQWHSDLGTLYERLEGSAVLESVEPELRVAARDRGRAGEIDVQIDIITPNHLTQRHTFSVTLDQSYLPPVIVQCQRVLERYPVKNPTER